MLSMVAPLMPSAYHHKNLVFTVVHNERASGEYSVLEQWCAWVPWMASLLTQQLFLEFTVLHNQRSPGECSIMNNGVQEFHGWPLSWLLSDWFCNQYPDFSITEDICMQCDVWHPWERIECGGHLITTTHRLSGLDDHKWVLQQRGCKRWWYM